MSRPITRSRAADGMAFAPSTAFFRIPRMFLFGSHSLWSLKRFHCGGCYELMCNITSVFHCFSLKFIWKILYYLFLEETSEIETASKVIPMKINTKRNNNAAKQEGKNRIMFEFNLATSLCLVVMFMLPDDVAQVKNDDADCTGWWWWRWWRHKQMANHEWNCVDCSLLSAYMHFGAWLKCDDDDAGGNDDADDGGICRLIISSWALSARLADSLFLYSPRI